MILKLKNVYFGALQIIAWELKFQNFNKHQNMFHHKTKILAFYFDLQIGPHWHKYGTFLNSNLKIGPRKLFKVLWIRSRIVPDGFKYVFDLALIIGCPFTV